MTTTLHGTGLMIMGGASEGELSPWRSSDEDESDEEEDDEGVGVLCWSPPLSDEPRALRVQKVVCVSQAACVGARLAEQSKIAPGSVSMSTCMTGRCRIMLWHKALNARWPSALTLQLSTGAFCVMLTGTTGLAHCLPVPKGQRIGSTVPRDLPCMQAGHAFGCTLAGSGH